MGEVERGEEKRSELSNMLTLFPGNPSDPWGSAPTTSSSSSTQIQPTIPGGDRQRRMTYFPQDTPRPAIGMAPTKSTELVERIRRKGIMVNATYDEELPLEARSHIGKLQCIVLTGHRTVTV